MDAGHRILVIDDDPIFVKSTKAILESHGYQVDTARDGDEGLAKMSQQKPDLVLLDVIMAWPFEGVSVSREMMNRKELQPIPIIMVTSIRSSEYRGAFPQDEYLHINRWLDKPSSPPDLVSAVEETISHHERYRKESAPGD